MTEFWKRTLSGAVYVGAVVGSILWHPIAFSALFLIICTWAVVEFHNLMGSPRALRDGAAVATVLLWLATQWHLFAPSCLRGSAVYIILATGYVLIILALLIDELWHRAENPIANWGNLLISQMMIALPFCAMGALLTVDKWLLLALFVLIWINDSGAYCVGSLTAKRPQGNHKLFPRVSPKKSWEGLIGGIAFAILAALVLMHYGWFDMLTASVIRPIGYAIVVGFALLACVFGNLGDLMESLMKRTIGVKDSGRFLPGHGGVLDRFDSMLLATPVIFVYSCLCYFIWSVV